MNNNVQNEYEDAIKELEDLIIEHTEDIRNIFKVPNKDTEEYVALAKEIDEQLGKGFAENHPHFVESGFHNRAIDALYKMFGDMTT